MPVLPGAKDLFIKQGQDLTISHVITGFQVAFPAFLDMFSDAYTCNWDEETVYGRMDSIPTFRNTQRTLSLAWDVPADSFDDAAANVAKVNQLITFLYPLYDKIDSGGGATAINQSPLVRVSFGNLVQNSVDGRGLLGHLGGLTFDPVLEHGMFTRKGSSGLSRQGGRTLRDRSFTDDRRRAQDPTQKSHPSIQGVNHEYYPKTFRLNFELTVLHEHELGFGIQKGEFAHADSAVNFGNFPYATGRPPPELTSNKPLKYKPAINKSPDPVQATAAVEREVVAGGAPATTVAVPGIPELPGERPESRGGAR